MKIGHKIKEYREAKKLSQEQLGSLVGKSQQLICDYESNKADIKISCLYDIAKALKTPINLFLESKKNSETKEEVHLSLKISNATDVKKVIDFLKKYYE